MEVVAVSTLRAVIEVALMSLLGQGVVGLFAGPRRASNPIYRLFQTIAGPALCVVRHIAPRRVMDKHLPVVAFFLLLSLWILLAYAKRLLCAADGAACGV